MGPSQIQVLVSTDLVVAPRESVLFSALKEDDWDAKPMTVGIWRFDGADLLHIAECGDSDSKTKLSEDSEDVFFESKSVKRSKISKIPESSPICVEKRVQWRHWVQMERTLWNSSDSSTLKLWIPRICSFIWSKRRAHNSEKGVDPIERQWKGGMSNCMSNCMMGDLEVSSGYSPLY